MANPTGVIMEPSFIAAGTVETSIALDPGRSYRLIHLATTEGGEADSADIFWSYASGVQTSYAAGAGVGCLRAGWLSMGIVVGGRSRLYFKTQSGTPVFLIVPGSR